MKRYINTRNIEGFVYLYGILGENNNPVSLPIHFLTDSNIIENSINNVIIRKVVNL